MTANGADAMVPTLTREQAGAFARIALANVVQEYPHKLDHVMSSDGDVLPPRILHPAFHASYDWHSCVHMHWLLVHVRRCFPDLPEIAEVERVCTLHFAADAIAAECAYLARPHAGAFERTYGWAWFLKLASELLGAGDPLAREWSRHLAPLAQAIEARYLAYLPRADYPIRYGMHSNSAFGLAFALDFAREQGRAALERACLDGAQRWFAHDVDAPVAWEPSGADFLSPALIEASLMRRVLGEGRAFATWLSAFLPRLGDAALPIATPVAVSDRTDAQIVHLDGLNLSRAWCWREIAEALPRDDPRASQAARNALEHLRAGMVGIGDAHYVGSHWLASFAALALDRRD